MINIIENGEKIDIGIPIVGIAVSNSTEGLKALEKFFNNTPSDSDVAFVVLVYGDSKFNLIQDLLQKNTQMRVNQVENGMLIHSKSIYIINTHQDNNFILKNGSCQIIAKNEITDKNINFPIDIFLESLAKECGDRAIGVILSGTKNDGIKGLESIKKAGGLTFVKSPTNAKLNAKIEKAIATGIVNHILPAQYIAKMIYEIIKKRQRETPIYQKTVNILPQTEIKSNHHNLVSNILENIYDAIISTDINGIIKTYNYGAEVTFGYTAQEMIGQSVGILYKNHDELTNYIISKLLVKERYETEVNCYDKKGNIIYIDLRLSIIRDAQGNILSLLGIARDITARKQAEMEKERLKQRLDFLIKHNPATIYSAENYGNYKCKFISNSIENLLGYTIADIVEDPDLWIKIIHPDDKQRVFDAINNLLFKNYYLKHEYRLQHKHGHYIWVYDELVLVRDEQGNPMEIVGYLSNVSDRKQQEIELRRYAEEVEDIYNNAPCGYHSLNPEGRFIRVNNTELQWLGYTREEMLGKSITEFFTEEGRQAFLRNYKIFQQQGWVKNLEYEMICKDGSILPVLISAEMVLDTNGKYLYNRATLLDIRELKQTEKQLLDSEAKLQAILNSSPSIIYVKNLKGKYTWVNQAFLALKGWNNVDVLGKNNYDLFPREIAKASTISDHKLIKKGEISSFEETIQIGDKKQLFFGHKFLLRDSEGKAYGICGMFTDISGRQQIEIALEQQIAAIEAAQDGIAILKDNVYIYLNHSHIKMFGYTQAEELLGKSWTILYSAEELARFEKEVFPILGRDRIWTGEAIATRKDGSTFYEGLSLTITTNGLLICVCQDISDRKQIEIQLRNLSDRLTVALQVGAIGTWEWDLAEQICWDEQMYNIYGLENYKYPITYQAWCDNIHTEDLEYIEALAQLAIQTKTRFEGEYRIYRPDGTLRWINTIAELQYNSEGKPIRMVGINHDITDHKQIEIALQRQVEKDHLMLEISHKIRESLNLQTIFQTACSEIREVMAADRVGIFKFYPESNFNDGEFVAESVISNYSSALQIRVHDHCFGENYAHLYVQGKYAAVSDIYNAGLQPCHRDILAQFQIKANLVIPLLCGENLWGLLCIHQCKNTRQWQIDEIEITQHLASQLAIAIQQADLYEKVQSELVIRQQAENLIYNQLRQQQALANITKLIRQSLSLDDILAIVTEQVQTIMNCDRVIIFRLFPNGRSQILEETVQAEFVTLKDRQWEDETWSQDILDIYWQGKPRIVPDVMNDIWTDCLVEYSREGQIQSKIVAPILQEAYNLEHDRWTIPDQNNKLWGILVVHACRTKRVWQDAEAQFLQQVANQLAIAIQQAILFKQLQQELNQRKEAQTELIERNRDLEMATKKAEAANRTKSDFLANMSHELRTPLNAILGMTEGLEEEVFGIINDKQNKALNTIKNSATHLLSLINDILDVAKIESGNIDLEYTSVPVSYICFSSLPFIKQQSLQKRLKILSRITPNLPNLLADERRIRQVLINLLNNAVKFTPAGGTITLSAYLLPPEDAPTQEKNYIRIAVKDTGIGISPENMQKLFQPFMQIDSNLNRQYEGTGLGLTLVKKIVDLHGGKVGLTSEVGVGSCFMVDLPCEIEQNNPEILNITPKSDINNFKFDIDNDEEKPAPLILLAEDNAANIITITSYLEAKGFRMVLAKDGKEAIDLMKFEEPNIIIMDIQMPGMGGLEAIKIIRQDAVFKDIPIIALTALAMKGDRERCLEAGATAYLSKPVRLKELATTINQLLT